MSRLKAIFTLLTAFWATALCWATPMQVGSYLVDVASQPSTIGLGKAVLRLRIVGSNGKPASHLSVSGIAQMPGMPMGEKVLPAPEETTPGIYDLPVQFAMQGAYGLKIEISGPGGKLSGNTTISTGQTLNWEKGGASPPSSPWLTWTIVAAVVLIGLWLFRRQIGPLARTLAKPIAVIGLAVIVGAVLLARYIVQTYRRPGAMTPMQAQTMTMQIPAPPGYAPITTAFAVESVSAPSREFQGQIVGYSQTEVRALVKGVITKENVYVGDSVTQGEIVAELDPSFLEHPASAARAEASAANDMTAESEATLRQARASQAESESRRREALAAVSESQQKALASQSEAVGASQQAAAAQASVSTAMAGIQSARSDVTYRRAVLRRSAALLKDGAISTQDYQSDLDAFNKSKAKLSEAISAHSAAKAALGAAQAMAAQARYEAAAGKAAINLAEANAATAAERVTVARNAVAAASSAIGAFKSQAMAKAVMAMHQQMLLGYANVTTAASGVITRRIISPGTFVQPGEAIFTVTQLSPIRVQANVPASALDSLQVGESATILGSIGQHAIHAKITSVARSVDPGTRLGTVEIVLKNAGQSLLPGQFARVWLPTQSPRKALAIPSGAVLNPISMNPSSQQQSFVWLIEKSPGGDLVVTKREVVVYGYEGRFALVVKGLNLGDQVAVEGASGLQEGESVKAIQKGGE